MRFLLKVFSVRCGRIGLDCFNYNIPDERPTVMITLKPLALCMLLSAGLAAAETVFESVGTSMAGWKVQHHQTSGPETYLPVWYPSGGGISGRAFFSKYHDAAYGGVMFNTNSFSLEIGETATATMDFEGQGVTAPDNLNHWWFSFGFRTGGEDPWRTGDLAASASLRTGSGPNLPAGFSVWNAWSDSWHAPYPRCAFRSDDNYRSDQVTISFSVGRTETGLGPSTLIVSNHVTGIRTVAAGLTNQVNENDSASGCLYFFCDISERFDGVDGMSSLGSQVKLSNIKLVVDKTRSQSRVEAFDPRVEDPVPLDTQINSIKEVKKLSNQAAGIQYTANIEGQVLNLHPRQSRVFLHDGTAGLYVELEKRVFEYDGLRVGSWVRIEGVTLEGGYSPIVYTTNLTMTGWSPLPHARKLDKGLYKSTSVDVDWVMVEGRPISMEYVPSYNHYLVIMEVLDTTVDVFVPYQTGAWQMMKPFMFQQVRVQGVLGATANRYRQMTGRTLYINSIDDFSLLPEMTGIVPRQFPVHELMQYGTASTGLVKTHGTVVSATKDTLYLRGEKNCLKASVFEERSLTPGDQVELVGYVQVQPVSPAFNTVSVIKTGTGGLPAPVTIQPDGAGIDPDWNYDLVSLDAEFVNAEKTFVKRRIDANEAETVKGTRMTLWCRVGERVFEAKLSNGSPLPAGLRPGSRVRLSGICHISRTKNPRLESMPDSIWLELMGDNSVVIIKRASWWTAKRLMWTLFFFIMLVLLFFIWVIALRKVVARQTETIGKQIERETTLNERQRIARELHDTVEQGLTALMMQLKRLQRKVKVGLPEEIETVETVESMLRVCREESRAAIQDLRGGILEEMDLASAIRKMVQSRAKETDIQWSVGTDGNPVRLTLFAEQQILRMVLEAVGNAIQHASPRNIDVHLRYLSDRLIVEIQDDGCGFDLEKRNKPGRFGVKGMHERANRLVGDFQLESRIGQGTWIVLTVPTDKFIKEESL